MLALSSPTTISFGFFEFHLSRLSLLNSVYFVWRLSTLRNMLLSLEEFILMLDSDGIISIIANCRHF